VAVPTVVGSPNILSPLKKFNTIMLNPRLDPLTMWPIGSPDVDDPAAGPRPVLRTKGPCRPPMVAPDRLVGRAPPIHLMEDRRRPRPRRRLRDVCPQGAVASRSHRPRRWITPKSGPRLEVWSLSIMHLKVVISGSLVRS